MSMAIRVLDLYLVKIEVCLCSFSRPWGLIYIYQGQHVQNLQLDADRVPAFVLAEIAFTVTLTSSNNTISQMAAKGLRHLAMIQRQPDAPKIGFISPEDYAKRARVFSQLGDPKVTVVGEFFLQVFSLVVLMMCRSCWASKTDSQASEVIGTVSSD